MDLFYTSPYFHVDASHICSGTHLNIYCQVEMILAFKGLLFKELPGLAKPPALAFQAVHYTGGGKAEPAAECAA